MQINHDNFRTVVPPRDRGGFPGKTAADNHGGPVLLIHAAGVCRKQSLIRSIQTIQYTGNPLLTAVGMPGQHQVKIIPAVYIDHFRTMTQKNRICLFVRERCNLLQLRSETALCPLPEPVNL